MKCSLVCVAVALVGAHAFNTFGGNNEVRTQPFNGSDQMHILPFPSGNGPTPGKPQILPYFPDNKNNTDVVKSLPYPTGSNGSGNGNDEMRIMPVSSGQRPARQTGDVHSLPYFPSNNDGFRTISSGSGSNGQVRILPKSTESKESTDDMRMQPFLSAQRFRRQSGNAQTLPYFPGNSGNIDGFKTVTSGSGTKGQVRILPKSTETHEQTDDRPFLNAQRVTRSTGDVKILPYFPGNKDATSGPKIMPFPSGTNGNDQVRILPVGNGNNRNDDMRIQPFPAGNGDFNIQPYVPRQ